MKIKEAYQLFLTDRQRYVEHQETTCLSTHPIINAITIFDHRMAFSFWFRIASANSKLLKLISKIYLRRISRKFGIQIPVETQIGPGLYIGHGIGIVINGKTKIGSNCNISQFLTIGSNKGTPATIGDNVYIGPGVCIVEDVKIGNNVKNWSRYNSCS